MSVLAQPVTKSAAAPHRARVSLFPSRHRRISRVHYLWRASSRRWTPNPSTPRDSYLTYKSAVQGLNLNPFQTKQ